MARKHALLREFEVVGVELLEETQVIEASRNYTFVIDIHDIILSPSEGWKLEGNSLVPPAGQAPSLKQMVMAKIKHYQSQANDILVDMYATNTVAGITTAQSDAMFSEYADVLTCIREGAWPTAVYRLEQKSPSGFVTQQMLDDWKNTILVRMI